jgi:hypothetical protein
MNNGISTDTLAGVQVAVPGSVSTVSAKDPVTDKLDKLLEYAEQTISDADLAKQEFDLKYDVTKQGLRHQNIEFYTLLIFKVIIVLVALVVVGGIACEFTLFLSGKTLPPKFIVDNSNVLLAMVAGSFLTIFGIFTALLKGLGQKEKNETPLAVEEVAKAILSVFKPMK